MSAADLSALARRIADDGLATLRARLLAEAPLLPLQPRRGDYDLNPGSRPSGARELAAAAVLLPIVARAEPTMLFTQRTDHLARHAGQVSFPGGRAQDGDATLVETALRETEEETGIAPQFIAVAGFLDAYETGTGYAILPVVGVLREGFVLMPSAHEVAEIFEVPLAFLLDPANRERKAGEWQGKRREYYAYTYNGHTIWGATAAMLADFSERMRAP
jgi:8-oxo-dGTP pyrophosphatase MutT (NUDIX family)